MDRSARGYIQPDMEVLQSGCGTGSTAIAHAPFVKHIQAIDISAKMIEIAEGKAEAERVANVTFERPSIDEVLAQAHRLLKPGGVFVTSTMCIGDTMKFFKVIAPIGKLLGLMPSLNAFTSKQLHDSLAAAGFEIDYQWQPDQGKGLFLVAKKAA